MCSGCSCADDSPPGVSQKVDFDTNGDQTVYQYNTASNRWKLVQKRIGVGTKSNYNSNYTARFYIKSKDKSQIEVYEGENGVGGLKLVETLTIEQHSELDLKENGQYLTGNGQ